MQLADRMQSLGTETAFDVLARARALEAQGRKIVHLEIGEPDFDTPPNIVQAAVTALQQGYTHYGPAAGLPELREAIAQRMATARGVKVDPARIVVTPGAKPIMFFTILALVNPGDEVIYPDPGFPIYESMVGFVGGVKKPIRLREEREFRMDVAELKDLITPRTRLVILNSPHNPTGSVLTRGDLEAVAEVTQKTGTLVLADEIYSDLLYDSEHVSLASLPGMLDRMILLDGFSKTYAMTGWRLGYGIFPDWLAPLIAKLQVNATSCTASFTQRAGVEALLGSQAGAEAMHAEFRRRRDHIVRGLNQIPGVTCLTPRGAFYVFPNIRGTGKTSQELADLLLYEGGVATLPGTAFGPAGQGYLRLSYANSIENLTSALEHMGEVLSAIRA
jgi:aspartate/methionine/tyrosine aminotransferase